MISPVVFVQLRIPCSRTFGSVDDKTVLAARSERRLYAALMDFAELQDVIDRTYGARDRERGTAPTVAWLCEEVGELAQAVRKGSREQQLHEFGDVVAWVATLANQVGIDLNDAVARYAVGCPKCDAVPCTCVEPTPE
jgi:NTP pyrophosphatase (non-canonical NTP hydrolase)